MVKRVFLNGSLNFRTRVILSILSGTPICIKDIRRDDSDPGIREHEILFLKLIQMLTSGTTVEINATGTELIFAPGVILGGNFTFDCGLERSIPYFLEALICIVPLSKSSTNITFTGVTSDNFSASIDTVRLVNLNIIKLFNSSLDIGIKILARGSSPSGGGKVEFQCSTISNYHGVTLTTVGQIKNIRGISATTNVSPHMSNRLIESARSFFNQIVPNSNVFINSDGLKGSNAGNSPGFCLSLTAESTSGFIYGSDYASEPGISPEIMGKKVASALLHEIERGGITDSSHDWMVLILMSVSEQNVSKVCLGEITDKRTIQLIDDIKQILNISFNIKREKGSENTQIVSCIGTGLLNFNKRSF